LTIGSFAVVAVTGILMFFHANTGLAKLAHEWLGWLLVIGAVAHTALNWKPFLAYFRKPAGLTIIGLMLVLGVASLCVSGGGGPGGRMHGPRAFMAVSGALEQSSLRVVAQVAKSSPETLIEKLKAQGIQVRSPDQTIGEIASENDTRGVELLGQILGDAGARGPRPSRG
jgi:hypothetical protein